ncbi:Calx-beta domain-containing protein [Actinokineospora diospyrosa]|uniref:Calx-beta domain-containing protein n=1 Tax=Actinokineospora diospyrosa TaxID=103728 RepID=A0ABT1I8T7_9PSEU|nr:Calx-beta domain-containing protein [Actinokineospora diospyrosa]MCP2269054.1 Calx-beta domain-containing protein [Actinokineospora diospyrosa]
MRALLLTAVAVAVALPVIPAQTWSTTACGPAAVSVGDYRQYEGTGSGTTPFSFTVTVTTAPGCTATGSVAYATEHISTGPADITATSGTLTWTDSTDAKLVVVGVVRDGTPEPEEAFSLRLHTPQNLVITRDRGRGQIIDDDLPPVETGLDGGKICWRYESSAVEVGVHTNTPARAPITVHYRTVHTGSNPPGYYPVKDGIITIPTGSTRGTATIRLKTEPNLPDEQFYVEIFSPSAGTLGLSRVPITVKSKR